MVPLQHASPAAPCLSRAQSLEYAAYRAGCVDSGRKCLPGSLDSLHSSVEKARRPLDYYVETSLKWSVGCHFPGHSLRRQTTEQKPHHPDDPPDLTSQDETPRHADGHPWVDFSVGAGSNPAGRRQTRRSEACGAGRCVSAGHAGHPLASIGAVIARFDGPPGTDKEFAQLPGLGFFSSPGRDCRHDQSHDADRRTLARSWASSESARPASWRRRPQDAS